MELEIGERITLYNPEVLEVIKSSIFDNAKDGYVRIRVMANADRIDEVVNVVSGYFPEVLEISNYYPNRDDAGVRVYLLVKLGG